MTSSNIILTMPEEPGAYWYWCDVHNKFKICEVVEKDGQMKAKFTNASIQGWVGEKSYFVGPIEEPAIGDDGKLANALLNQDIKELCRREISDLRRTDIGFGYAMLVELCQEGTQKYEAMSAVRANYPTATWIEEEMLELVDKHLCKKVIGSI